MRDRSMTIPPSPGQRAESYYLPIFADHMRKMAPKEADTKSWR
jgi:hypothetical protein